jgi:hypothetical protein
MGAVSVFDILRDPKGGVAPHPNRELALLIALVTVAAGFFAPLHLLGTVNLVFASPKITPLAIIGAILAGACIVLLLRRGTIQRPQSFAGAGTRLSRGLRAILGLTAIVYAAFALDTILSFPNGNDPIAYHIDVALKWLQHGTLGFRPAWGWQYSLPGNAELPALAALVVNMPKAIAIGNLLAAILLGISVYLIAWKITPGIEPALLAAVVVVTSPMVVYQAFQLWVDLFGTAFLVAAIALFVWRSAAPVMCLCLAGYAAGIAIGSKPVFWIYGAMFAAGAMAAILRERKWRLKSGMLLLAAIMLSSGFWFLRSTVTTGNPLYPMRVSVGRLEILRGYSRTDITPAGFGIGRFRDALVLPWSDTVHHGGFPVGADVGLGPLVAAIVVPGILFVLVRVVKRRASVLERVLLISIGVGIAIWALVFLRMLRFALPILALSCALTAPMLQALLAEARRLPVILFLIGVSLNGLYCFAEPGRRAVNRIRSHDLSRSTYYGYPPIIDHLPPGSRVVDLTETHGSSFLLAGASLSNYVRPAAEEMRSGDYVVRDGAPNPEDATLRSKSAKLLYDAMPPNLYPKTARRWRVYRVP